MDDVMRLATLVAERRVHAVGDSDTEELGRAVLLLGQLACAAAFDAGLAQGHAERIRTASASTMARASQAGNACREAHLWLGEFLRLHGVGAEVSRYGWQSLSKAFKYLQAGLAPAVVVHAGPERTR